MKQNRKQKIELLKGILNGRVSANEALRQQGHAFYTLEEPSEPGAGQAVWKNIVGHGCIIKLPYNGREPLPADVTN